MNGYMPGTKGIDLIGLAVICLENANRGNTQMYILYIQQNRFEI